MFLRRLFKGERAKPVETADVPAVRPVLVETEALVVPERGPYKRKDSYSQHGEDRFIKGMLPEGHPRFVVDVGANDGYSWSNSYLFGALGYKVLLVEPMPDYVQKCHDVYGDAPNVIIEQAAIAPEVGKAEFFVNLDTASDLLAMRSSLTREKVFSAKVESIVVPTTPLHLLLEKHGWPSDYALLSVDAEGGDLDVLKSARLDTYRPMLICVEEQAFGNVIHDYLVTQGYTRSAVLGPNGIYRHN